MSYLRTKSPSENSSGLNTLLIQSLSLNYGSGETDVEQVVCLASDGADLPALNSVRSVLCGCAGRALDALSRRKVCDRAPGCFVLTLQAGERRRGRTFSGTASHGLPQRSEEHTSELQSLAYLVCRLLLEKKKKKLHHSATCTIPTTCN